jgi:hypothetical protein
MSVEHVQDELEHLYRLHDLAFKRVENGAYIARPVLRALGDMIMKRESTLARADGPHGRTSAGVPAPPDSPANVPGGPESPPGPEEPLVPGDAEPDHPERPGGLFMRGS